MPQTELRNPGHRQESTQACPVQPPSRQARSWRSSSVSGGRRGCFYLPVRGLLCNTDGSWLAKILTEVEPLMSRLSTIFTAFVILLASFSISAAQDKTIIVFAAASMENALNEVNAAYTAKAG